MITNLLKLQNEVLKKMIWQSPVNMTDKEALQNFLEVEDKQLGEILQNLSEKDIADMDNKEKVNLRIRYMRFINLWNFNNVNHEKENFYICPIAQGAVPPMKCMFCSYGHMAFDCHFPYDCNSEFCNHYDHQKEEY